MENISDADLRTHTKIKSFVGHSKNSILTQIWISLCVYLLLAYVKFSSKLEWSMQQMLRVLQLNLFMRRDLMGLFRGDPPLSAPETTWQLSLI